MKTKMYKNSYIQRISNDNCYRKIDSFLYSDLQCVIWKLLELLCLVCLFSGINLSACDIATSLFTILCIIVRRAVFFVGE